MIKRTEIWRVNNNADNRLGVDSLRVARKIIWKKKLQQNILNTHG